MQEQQDSIQNDKLFLDAIVRGDIEVVRTYLKDETFNPAAEDNKAFELAVEKGHYEITQLLLNDLRVDPAANKKKAIVLANQNKKNIKILELLVFNDRANPDPIDSFLWAVGGGHTKLV